MSWGSDQLVLGSSGPVFSSSSEERAVSSLLVYTRLFEVLKSPDERGLVMHLVTTWLLCSS